MTTGNTTLLGLGLPVEGELDGTWGDIVNNSITSLLDSAVAGTTTLSVDADVTLTDTALAANQARQANILWTASNGATTRNITAPARSKAYIVINAGTGSIVLRGAGPTTGVTIVSGERCVAAWNGSDFVKVASTAISNLTGALPIANGGTGKTTATEAFNALAPSQTSNTGKVLITDGTNTSWSALPAAGSDTQVQLNSSGVLGASSSLTFNGTALSVNGIVVTRGANSINTNVSVSGAFSSSLGSITTGQRNVAFGFGNLSDTTTGSNNVAFGGFALLRNTTGSNNAAIGETALRSNTTASNNLAMGTGALTTNTTASDNVAVGVDALTLSNGSNNTAVGYQALTGLTTGTNNIGIGRLVGSSITTGSNNTIIGPFTGSAALTGVVAINAGASNRIYVDAIGNVGFGTTSPTAAIDHTGSTLRLRTSRTPASASDTGVAGEICWDSNYVYVCVATDTWKRSALSTW